MISECNSIRNFFLRTALWLYASSSPFTFCSWLRNEVLIPRITCYEHGGLSVLEPSPRMCKHSTTSIIQHCSLGSPSHFFDIVSRGCGSERQALVNQYCFTLGGLRRLKSLAWSVVFLLSFALLSFGFVFPSSFLLKIDQIFSFREKRKEFRDIIRLTPRSHLHDMITARGAKT